MPIDTISKGPWRLDGPDVYGDYNILPADEELAIGAVVQNGFRSDAETKLNAHLVAASYDLLSIAQRWAALDGGAWNVTRHSREKEELLQDTRAAIAKAEGRQ